MKTQNLFKNIYQLNNDELYLIKHIIHSFMKTKQKLFRTQGKIVIKQIYLYNNNHISRLKFTLKFVNKNVVERKYYIYFDMSRFNEIVKIIHTLDFFKTKGQIYFKFDYCETPLLHKYNEKTYYLGQSLIVWNYNKNIFEDVSTIYPKPISKKSNLWNLVNLKISLN